MADRRYDDKEVGQILKAAAEMQSGLAGTGNPQGMTLAELQRVAGEVGIDSGNIGRAAFDLDAASADRTQIKPGSFLLEKSFPSEMSDEAWDQAITELRRFTGRPGKSEIEGCSREWSGGSEMAALMLSATTRNGRTKLKLLGDSTGVTAMGWTAGLATSVLAMALVAACRHIISGGPAVVFLLAMAAAFVCNAVVVMSVLSSRKKFSRQASELMVRLGSLMESQQPFEATPARNAALRSSLSGTELPVFDELQA